MRYSRQNKILELVQNQEIETQDKLANLLRENGYDVTQATISRDIKELQLVKVLSSSGKYKYAVSKRSDAPITDRFIKVFRETMISVASAQNLIVIKTLSGCGAAVGEAIDSLDLPHMVGSVSGDNTTLIIVDEEANVPEIKKVLDSMIQKDSDKE